MAKQPAPNQKKMAIVLSAVLILMTLLAGVLALLKGNPYARAEGGTSISDPSEPEGGNSEPEELPPDEPSSSGLEDEPSLPGPEPDNPEEPAEPVYLNVPDEMRAVLITAGRDYMTGSGLSRAEIASQIDQALSKAKELSMNSIIIDTKLEERVLFASSALQMAQADLDCVGYLTDRAREMGFFLYATYDVSDLADADGTYLRACSADGQILDSIRINVGEFAEKYQFDGILLRNYDAPSSPESYAAYLQTGGGIGYENGLRQTSEAMVMAAAAAIRQAAPGTQVGLMASAVWENQSADPQGSETSADYTSLGSGNADTKRFVESGAFDFVMVENFASTTDPNAEFRTVARWWKQIADAAGVTLYTMHANERLGVEPYGWQVMEQLTKQVIDLREIGAGEGSAFHSLKALADNPGGTTTTLVQYMNREIDETYVLQQLSISKPAQLVYTTREPSVTFQGASDPREKVTINGEEIPRNESGYFTVRKELSEGLNIFAISHKNKTFTYQITREVIVLKEVQPTGAISVDGGMLVAVTAQAYEGASVTASLGGQTITLSQTEAEGDETDRDSGYRTYTGVFTMPSASESATKLGTITVTAAMTDGHSMTLEGASVTVNKKAELGDGVVVQVVADQAETFPITSLDDSSHAGYYPLPKGTVDRTYGSEIIYKNGNTTKSYWKLQSGVRVYSQDITTGGQMPDNNQISEMSVKSSDGYTTVALTTKSKAPYTVSYDGSQIIFKFSYTASVPESRTFGSDNALFASADWSGSNLTLKLKKTGGFLGYKAYYENDTRLVLRFNNSPGSLAGARIVVDPGHGGDDPGALGFYPDKDEADINLEIAQKLASELKSRGASVLTVTPGSTLASRMESARAFNPQVLVSIHNNTNGNPQARGSEAYYFYPFQKQLAALISANVADALGTTNRGAKQGLYYITRESQFACVLVESGFISNEEEYTKLISSKYQNRIVQGIANGVSSYLGGAYSGGGTGSGDDPEETEEPEETQVSGVSLDVNRLSLKKGDSYTLTARIEPSTAENQEVSWESSDEEIVQISRTGKVTAVANGKATITVTTEDGGYTADCEVEVSRDGGGTKVTGISMRESLRMQVGELYILEPTVEPATAENKTVLWSSSDTSIAVVNASGRVAARKKGTVTITATTEDGGYTADCEVTIGGIGSGGEVEEIEITGSTEIETGTRTTLEAVVSPSDAEDTRVIWSISDTDIADFSGDPTDRSCKVEGLRDGTVTVTAKARDGSGVTATLKLKVGSGEEPDKKEEPEDGIRVESVSIDGDSKISRGTRTTYQAEVRPSNAEDGGVAWSVSDDEILVIHEIPGEENRIKVEGLKKGEAILRAAAYDNKKIYDEMVITVS